MNRSCLLVKLANNEYWMLFILGRIKLIFSMMEVYRNNIIVVNNM